MKMLIRAFERILWDSRWLVLLAVSASLLVAVCVFYFATVDVVHLFGDLNHYAGLHDEERVHLRQRIVADIIEIIDAYLLAATMLIFALGLYELFISDIQVAEGSAQADNILLIHTLDDLKDRLAKMILLMLAIKFFEQALRQDYKSPLDLLYLGGGILLIGGAIYLSHPKKHDDHGAEKEHVKTDDQKGGPISAVSKVLDH